MFFLNGCQTDSNVSPIEVLHDLNPVAMSNSLLIGYVDKCSVIAVLLELVNILKYKMVCTCLSRYPATENEQYTSTYFDLLKISNRRSFVIWKHHVLNRSVIIENVSQKYTEDSDMSSVQRESLQSVLQHI